MGDFIPDVEINTIISYLSKGIKQDRNLFVKAKIDPMFNNVRSQVDFLLEKIFQKTKSNAEEKVSYAEIVAIKMEMWINSDYASSDDKQKFELILNNISDAKSKLKTHTYFGYTDVLEIMNETNKIIETIQSSINNQLEYLKKQKKQISNEFNNIFKKINDFTYRRKQDILIRIVIIYTILFVLSSAFNFFMLIVFSIIVIVFLNFIFSNYMHRFDVLDKIIGSFIILITLNTVLSIISKNLGEIIFNLILLMLALVPIRFKSELSDLNNNRKNHKEQIRLLEHRIEAAEQSLIEDDKRFFLQEMIRSFQKLEQQRVN